MINNARGFHRQGGIIVDFIDALKLDKSEFKDLSEKNSNESKRARKQHSGRDYMCPVEEKA
jgi:hypothetical protein